MTYPIEEVRARARGATIAVALAGVAWGTYGVVDLAALERGDDTGIEIGSLWLGPPVVLSIACIVAGVMNWLHWFRAVHATAEPFGVVRELGGWRLWGWLVPYTDLVVPKRTVNDIWWTPGSGERTPLPWQVQVWWGCWVVAILMSDLPILPIDGTPGEVLSAFGSLLVGLSTPFAVWTIRLLTERVAQLQAAAPEEEPVAA